LTASLALSDVEPLDRQTLGERAYGQISELLISGRVAPGDKLSLRSTAEALGVSMMPVREAITRLIADQALEVAPNRAVRVPIMTTAQFRDLTDVRIAIEGHAAALAAGRATPADIARIAEAEASFREEGARSTPELARAVEINKDLHFAVYQAAGSPLLLGIVRGLWLKAGPVINLDLRAHRDRLAHTGAVSFHAQLLDAIRSGAPELARRAIADDIGGAADFILSRGTLAP
jgi:DNA-binding GntR family transcriptional regulator